jgi:hypothetical protein
VLLFGVGEDSRGAVRFVARVVDADVNAGFGDALLRSAANAH